MGTLSQVEYYELNRKAEISILCISRVHVYYNNNILEVKYVVTWNYYFQFSHWKL